MAPGALLLHGLTSTPAALGLVGTALAGAGCTVSAPTLPGHGTSTADLDRAAWDDWVQAAESARAALARSCHPVVAVGHSMGGALACWLAAAGPGPGLAGLVLVNPFVDPPAESFRDLLRAVLDQGHRCLPGIAGDLADPAAVEEGAYRELPVRPLLSLCAGLDALWPRLGLITCPVLIMTSREDHVVPTVSSDLLAERVAGPVERVWLERSYHVAPLDHDRDHVARRTVEFVAGTALMEEPGRRPAGRRP